MKPKKIANIILTVLITVILGILQAHTTYAAATAKEIDASVDAALNRFTSEVKGAKEFLKAAKGVLIIPKVIQGGLIVGAEYGEGALKIDGKTVDYYNIAAGSVGFQIGAQQKDIILVFVGKEALEKFRASDGWQAGVDGTVAAINVGAEGSIDTTKIKEPIVGFVFGQKGLMAGVSIKGLKFTKLITVPPNAQ
jgi:lipid-binding SYLF domain-containing protein